MDLYTRILATISEFLPFVDLTNPTHRLITSVVILVVAIWLAMKLVGMLRWVVLLGLLFPSAGLGLPVVGDIIGRVTSALGA